MEPKTYKTNYFCLDTCTWIYLANGTEPITFLKNVIDLMDNNRIKILLPQIVLDEWNRNKNNRTIHKHLELKLKAISKAFKPISDVLDKIDSSSIFGYLDHKTSFKEEKDNLKTKLESLKSTLLDITDTHIHKIEEVFVHRNTITLDTESHTFIEAAKLALNKKAPVGTKNGIADALILLTLLAYIKKENLKETHFISYNTKDFTSNSKDIHPDLKPLLDIVDCKYHSRLATALKSIDDQLVSDDLMREILSDIQTNIEICTECDGYHGFGNEIEYGDTLEVLDYHQDDTYPYLPFTEMPEQIESTSKEYQIEIGVCQHCSAEYLKCHTCGNTILINEHTNKNGHITCECGLIYHIEYEYDKKGMLIYENCFLINPNIKECGKCGEEFIDELKIGICTKCEDEYAYN